ncbi:M56 family metallopeptidase [Roseovarius pelagicus]|uniref:M56 family metallopeptidase n=1 Tax=Roseovarius pelagicus TaxID=2980108 RepID=A0ABY6DBK2_9RHOB|nr:M56 family metallopeptidase [Roseovarius pelagicus]UXX83532.1 M56 family metallopeptidase [Roseovarius pelagicus]
MIRLNDAFDIYIDANIVLVLTAAVWILTRAALRATPLRAAFALQLRLAYTLLAAMALVPLSVFALELARNGGLLDKSAVLNLSDIAVAQFLDGRIAMSPVAFEDMLNWRARFTQAIVTPTGAIGLVIAVSLMLGSALALVCSLRSLIRVHGLIGRSYLWRRIGSVDLRLTDEIHVPFSTRGVQRHYVVLPSAMLAREGDLRIAVAHELQHARQGDLGWALAIEGLRALFFWNPAYHFWRREVERLRELACDQQVLARRHFSVKAYCDCLIRACRNSLRDDRRRQIGVPVVSLVPLRAARAGCRASVVLRGRILSMLHARPLARIGRGTNAAIIGMVVASLLMLSAATQRSGDWSHDRLMLSTIVNLERLAQHNAPARLVW